MTTKELWKRVQEKVGATPDGIPGRQTATKILEEFDIAPKTRPNVKGTGKGIKRIAIHCSATPEGRDIDAATIRQWHKNQGWSDIGYHFVIKLDGTIERGRPESIRGSHVRGFNTGSIGVVYIGGVDSNQKPKDTRTQPQKEAMEQLVRDLVSAYPGAKVLGHKDHPNVAKACPSFDAVAWWESVK